MICREKPRFLMKLGSQEDRIYARLHQIEALCVAVQRTKNAAQRMKYVSI